MWRFCWVACWRRFVRRLLRFSVCAVPSEDSECSILCWNLCDCHTHALSVMMFARLSHFYLFILLPINYKPACVCLIMHQCVHQTSFRTQSSQGRLCVVGHKQEVAACGFISYSALTCGWVLTPQVVPLRQRNALVAQPDSAHGRQTRRGFR